MVDQAKSLKSAECDTRPLRSRLSIKDEFLLALLPTTTVLGVLGMVEVLSEQRLLFSSLASSAFLIYLDPRHGTNRVSALVLSHLSAAVIGLLAYLALGPGYFSAGIAMVVTIAIMILLDTVHPPAVSTSLSFALRTGQETDLVLFSLAVGITALLVILERAALWLLAHRSARQQS